MTDQKKDGFDVVDTLKKAGLFIARHAVLFGVLAAVVFGIWIGGGFASDAATSNNADDARLVRLVDSTGHISDRAAFDSIAAVQTARESKAELIRPAMRLGWGLAAILMAVFATQIVLFCMTQIKFLETYKLFRGHDGQYDSYELGEVKSYIIKVFFGCLAVLALFMVLLK